ncbi:MAB_1171c family putative transporter [Saccharopolyspora elongata]|uniref:MAB_1171c family putative transporter n=1 Tax=Saccharopolyspora elongata TaxID=2530387 RepID=UPI001F3497FA|nr:MAB_1171c family putative transporter [Saccharopolyspora elongata]
MILEGLVAAALSLALLWCLHRLWRTPRDRALWMVSACLAFMALNYPLGWLANAAAADSVVQHGVPKLLQNAVIMFGYFFLMLFFLFSAAPADKNVGRRAWREVVPLAVVVIAQIVSMAATPEQLRDHRFSSSSTDLQIPGIAGFYFVGAAYLVYALVQAARFALRYAAESGRRVRVGLRIAAAGLGIRAVSGSLRVLLIVVSWSGGGLPDALRDATGKLAAVGGGVFVLGVLCPAVLLRLATVRVWWRHRRAYRQLRPLWEALNAVYPKDALDRRPRSLWRERVSPRRVRRHYWRRVIEIRDGLVQLSPHLADFGYDSSRPTDQQVTAIRHALRHRHDGLPATTTSAVLVAAPAHVDNVETDVVELLALNQHFVPDGSAAARGPDLGLRQRNALMISKIRAQKPAAYVERRYALRVLAVRGRNTGEIRTVPIAVTQLDGRRYVCSPHRRRDWVRNLLAAGQVAIERDEHPVYRAVLVEGHEAARVIHTYLNALGTSSMAWPFTPGAAVSEIRAHTSTTAVFRLESHQG